MSKTIRISDKIYAWLKSVQKSFGKKHGVKITYNQMLSKLKKGEKIET